MGSPQIRINVYVDRPTLFVSFRGCIISGPMSRLDKACRPLLVRHLRTRLTHSRCAVASMIVMEREVYFSDPLLATFLVICSSRSSQFKPSIRLRGMLRDVMHNMSRKLLRDSLLGLSLYCNLNELTCNWQLFLFL